MRIEASNLSKVYRDAASSLIVLESLSFTFPPRGSLAIVGRSGIGKSTLLHLLGGLDRPSAGHVYFDDTNISLLDPDALAELRGRRVGFIFQFHNLLHEFDAVENVSMPLIIAGASPREAAEKSVAVLTQVGLAQRLNHRPSELSGGEQQRVAIARAIVSEPDVILADEPTGNLDQKSAEAVQALLIDINRKRENVLVVVTHNLDLARSLDAVVEMLPGGRLEVRDKGRI